ncbi:MAG: hypothetical protein VYB00_03830, partial [Candidatus Thermoplasmatota archaeon]|nr:hypothetical protein [Candidatus Thermoplasmatota archaeon]
KSDDPINMDLWIAGIGDSGTWKWALNVGMAKWPEATSLDHSGGVSALGGSFSTTYVDFDDSRIWNWDNESTYQWPDAFFALLNHNPNQDCTDADGAADNPGCDDFDDGSPNGDNSGQDGSGDGTGGTNASEDVGETSEVGVFGILVVLLIVGMIIVIILISRTEEESSDE